ncbi:MAG TPA: DUF3891 family protein [Thermoanaerobaculia bacterium]|nr:DUF3891 family protein [Thermoanaerobaculia bacterium]
MIVVDTGNLLLITQPDHARFAAELLSLWRTDGLPDHPRRAELLFAVREHDNGWRETDAAPHWDAERGRPHDFLSLPRQERMEIWQRGTARFAGEHPYASLLVTRHALQLHRERQEEEWQPFLDYLGELYQGLVEATGAGAEEVEADYRWLDLTDLISLAVCNRWPEPFERHGVRGRFQAGADNTLHLDPFPLAGATAFRIPVRRIPGRAYRGDADLGGELAAARWEKLAVRVAPEP